MRYIDVTVSLETASHGTRQETRAAKQYDTVAEAVADLGEPTLLQFLNSKIISRTRGQIKTQLYKISTRTGPRLGPL